MTEPDNQTAQGFDVRNQQVADCDSSRSEGEPDAVRESGCGGDMAEGGEGGTEEEDDENDEGPSGTEVNLDDEEEEMRDRLCRLVAQARLSYFASTDDELDKVGVTEGDQECGRDAMEEQEVEEEDDGEEKVREREQSHEEMGDLPFRICQLEREVRASQFSSTEDELDRAGAEDDEAGTGDDGVREELAVQVCRLASQVNATQFSSTEDELDRAGRDEEGEAMDEETLWKLQAEKAVQAAHLRDLSCLVAPSQFASSEGLEMDEETESGNDAGPEGSVWERTESLEDLDVRMFDLRAESEDGGEKVLHSQKKPVMSEEEKEKVTEETDTDREEAEATREDARDGEENRDSTAGDSDDEDEEFNRIISSMLMMTLEDMQGGVFDGDNGEDAGKRADEGVRAERRPDGHVTSNDISEEAGSFEPLEGRGRRTKPASAAEVKEGGERDGGDRSGAEVRGHSAGEAAPVAESEEEPGGGGGSDGEDQAPDEDQEHRPAEEEEESETLHREGPPSPREIRIVRSSIFTSIFCRAGEPRTWRDKPVKLNVIIMLLCLLFTERSLLNEMRCSHVSSWEKNKERRKKAGVCDQSYI